ncbi:MAG: ABC transporter ATP-binding protein [Desulfosarcinaceae bacterium]|nr:ABC transporter ATP-binding protein [Desulfosarcinaceae bacterium]
MRLEGICKHFSTSGNRIDVLDGVDAAVRSGERLAIVGASGIGKSTLLHILGTLERPDSGNLWVAGHKVFDMDDRRLAEFRNATVGFVFQFHHLLAEFSALENVMMPALIQGWSKHRASESAQEILLRVGLKERLRHRATELSGGEQQRVALARALVLRPALLLADEPTGNLDQHTGEQVHDLLFELNEELSMTMVVVTHNLRLAAQMSRCMTLMDGKLAETGC